MAQIVYTDVAEGSDFHGSLFQGTKFWFSHRVPSRSHFIDQVKANGGEVVPLEKFADVKIVDHFKKDNAPGTHSYQYIERSVRNGVLEDLDDHRAGPSSSTARPAGAIGQPTKGTKVPFSAEDDRILREWVGEYARKGQATSGNEIFKQLWQKNPRHPWQSWRDRWVKYIKPTYVPDNAPPTPPTDQAEVSIAQPVQAQMPQPLGTAFSGEDAKALLRVAQDISNVHPSQKAESWQTWATAYPQHSAQEWQNFWEANIRPVYLKQLAKEGKRIEKATSPVSPEENEEGPLHKSLSRNPGSAKVLSKSPLQERRVHEPSPQKAEIVRTASPSSSEEETVHARRLQGLQDSTRSPKRKWATVESNDPTSSPPSYSISQAVKRQRLEKDVAKPTEIPSTPERFPLAERRTTPIVIKREIVDLEDDESVADQEEEDEDEEEEEEEEEAEDEEYDEASLPRAPSQSLSEPDYHHPKLWSISKGPRRRLDFDIPPVGGWDGDDDDEGSLQGPEIVSTRRGQQDTQALLQETPQLDFTVAEPDEGWDLLVAPLPSSPPVPISPTAADEDDGSIQEPEIVSTRRGQQDTQALLQETPQLDFTVAEPDEGWDLLVPPLPSSPPVPVSPTATDEDDGDSTPDERMTEREMIAKLENWIDARLDGGVDVDLIDLALKSASNDPDLAEVVLEALQSGDGVPDDVQGVWTEEDDGCLEAVDARRIDRMIGKHGREALDRRYEFLKLYAEELDE